MHEMPIRGEIKTLACKEGSSGVFTGSIEGLYQGYRFASTTPDEQHFVLEAQNGTIALTLHQEIVTPLPPRPAEHPFAGGKDPFANMPAGVGHGPPPGAGAGGPPPGMGAGGPPPGVGAGGPPPGVAAGGPPAGMRPGGPPPGMGPGGGPPPGADPADTDVSRFRKIHYMQVKLQVDPEKSTGIFAGATGEMELETPAYRMAGYLVINAKDGDLRLNFLEKGQLGQLNADLWVDGENSTGIYKNAKGDLKFALTTTPPNFGRGPYEGTIWLEQAPPGG
jgi:hypothetical protein